MGALAQHHNDNDFFKNQRSVAENHHNQNLAKSYCNKDNKSGYKHHKKQAKMEHRIERKVTKMTRKLNLSLEQQQNLKQLFHKQLKQKRALKREFRQEVKLLLTPQQQQKLQHRNRT